MGRRKQRAKKRAGAEAHPESESRDGRGHKTAASASAAASPSRPSSSDPVARASQSSQLDPTLGRVTQSEEELPEDDDEDIDKVLWTWQEEL
eukprot:12424906-Karenia_brevis.AAC.1